MPRGLRTQVRPNGQRLLVSFTLQSLRGPSWVRTFIASSSDGRSVARPEANAHTRQPTSRTHSKLVVWTGVVDRLLKMGRRARR